MVGAMFERFSSYFEKIRKQFKFKIVDQKSTAICSFSSLWGWFLPYSNKPFHLLTDSSTDIGSTQQNKSFAVPSFFTTFEHLFSNSSKLETNGNLAPKLKLAIDFNDKTGEKIDPATVQKRLPISFSTTAKMLTTTKTTATKTTVIAQKKIHNTISKVTGHEQIQTDQICTETLKRVKSILSGPHSGAFCKVMDIIVSGYGKLDIDSELLFVRLVFEEKNQILVKNILFNRFQNIIQSAQRCSWTSLIFTICLSLNIICAKCIQKSPHRVFTLNWLMFEKKTYLCINVRESVT